MVGRVGLDIGLVKLLHQVRGEYVEMPGLRVTAHQAQRLFGLDPETWDAVSAALLDAKFLYRTPDGLFVMG